MISDLTESKIVDGIINIHSARESNRTVSFCDQIVSFYQTNHSPISFTRILTGLGVHMRALIVRHGRRLIEIETQSAHCTRGIVAFVSRDIR